MEKETIPPPRKFTQEIKENWLENLKSGKYQQGFGDLVTDVLEEPLNRPPEDGNAYYCCIGVLADCTPGLNNFAYEEGSHPYDFLGSTIGDKEMQDIWRRNDEREHRPQARDYSNVIPLIESLPVQE